MDEAAVAAIIGDEALFLFPAFDSCSSSGVFFQNQVYFFFFCLKLRMLSFFGLQRRADSSPSLRDTEDAQTFSCLRASKKQTHCQPQCLHASAWRRQKSYLVAALSVACLHSIITGFISVLALMKPGGSSEKLKFHFVVVDTLLLGIVAAATGAAGGVAYIGLKGNSHSGWNKICHTFNTYCIHVGASIILSLISSIALLLLVWINVYVLSKKIARR